MDLGRRGDAFPRYPIYETGLRSDPEGQKLPCRRDAHRNPIRHAHNPNNFFNDIVKTNAELSLEPLPLDAFDMGVNSPDTMIHAAIGDFTCKLKKRPIREGWEYLIQFDQFSTRSVLLWSTPNIQTP